jgi:DNA-binding MarR family transcriptional regulator
MKITHRQEEFIRKLLDLCQELEGPIHYSTLAEQLGVSPFTAYDMLRVLEDKGLVSSTYQVPADKTGPGRAERVFYPTQSAQELVQSLTQEAGVESWNAFTELVLEKARNGEFLDRELAEEMLAHMPPEGQGQVWYCVEVMTIITRHLRTLPGRQVFLAFLPELLPDARAATRVNLCLLGGMAFGLLTQDPRTDLEWGQNLLLHIQKYLDIVIRLNARNIRQLGEQLIPVFSLLADTGETKHA